MGKNVVERAGEISDTKLIKLTVAFPVSLDKSGTPNKRTEEHVMKVLREAIHKLLDGWLTTRTRLEFTENVRWY